MDQALHFYSATRRTFTPPFTDNNLDGQQDLSATVYIPPYQELPGRVAVRRSDEQGLDGRVLVVWTGPPYNLPGRVFVLGVGQQDLPARVYQPFWSQGLLARVLVEEAIDAGQQDLPGLVEIVNEHQDLAARVLIPCRQDLPGRTLVDIFFLPARVLVQRSGSQDLPGLVMVPAELPGDVEPLTADAPEATWLDNPVVTFLWEVAGWITVPVVAYYWKLTRLETEEADQTWNDQTTTTAILDLSDPAYGGGQWFFKVAARNTAGFFGPTASYEVWFNMPPSPPGGGYLRADNHDILLQVPLVGSRPGPTISWSPSQDANSDSLTYEVQIASRSDFGPLANGETSMAVSQAGIETNHWVLASVPNPGKWFCRVRCSDGKQSSDWSAVGAFRLNAPPSRPTNLAAAQL